MTSNQINGSLIAGAIALGAAWFIFRGPLVKSVYVGLIAAGLTGAVVLYANFSDPLGTVQDPNSV